MNENHLLCTNNGGKCFAQVVSHPYNFVWKTLYPFCDDKTKAQSG